MKTITRFFLLSPMVALLFAGNVNGVTTDWTDWAASDLSTASGTVGGVGVSFSGLLSFAQLDSTTQIGGSSSTVGVNFWTEGTPAPYTGNALIDNAPTANELLAFNLESSVNTITFGSPVENPVMAIVSQGRTSSDVTYSFDQPFTVLSEGRGYWGDGTYDPVVGNELIGYELHGVIQFAGTVSSITWASSEEYWHGFTIGVPQQTAVPEAGATLSLLGLAMAGLAIVRRRLSI